MPASRIHSGSHSLVTSDDNGAVITVRLSHVGWQSYLLAALAGSVLLLAIVFPLWVYRNLKIDFPPIVGDDVVVTSQNQSVSIVVLMNDADPIGFVDPKTVTIERPASHGEAKPDAETGVVSYSPGADFTGRDIFMYSVRNKEGVRSNLGMVKVTVNP